MKKIYLETARQKVTTGLVTSVLVGGVYVLRDDRDRPRDHQGMPIEQPHDQHERAPIEVGSTSNVISASGSSTASVNTFTSVLFEGWQNGKVEWPVILHPDLYITVGPAARVERSDHLELAEHRDEGRSNSGGEMPTIEEKTTRLESARQAVNDFVAAGGDLGSKAAVPVAMAFVNAFADLAKEFGYEILKPIEKKT